VVRRPIQEGGHKFNTIRENQKQPMSDIHAARLNRTAIAVNFIVMLLAMSILIQNTCPCGRAGKSAFLSIYSDNVPVHKHVPSFPDGRNGAGKYSSCLKPLFVFQISTPDNSEPVFTPCCRQALLCYSQIKEVFLEPPFRPPVNPLSA